MAACDGLVASGAAGGGCPPAITDTRRGIEDSKGRIALHSYQLLGLARLPARRPSVTVVGLDQREQLCPRDHGVHLGEKPFPPGHFPLLAPRDPGELPLLPIPNLLTPSLDVFRFYHIERLAQSFPRGLPVAPSSGSRRRAS